ncbi:DNA cytosine methyltransferase [Gemmiger formicilis]|uniref:DNA cytosine methyltransferase n=1 Tax=Gemmiger formicilis TaxID=745368 RepID=UPI003522DE83
MKILSRSFYAEILALQGFPAGLRDSYFIRDKSGYSEIQDNQTFSIAGSRKGFGDPRGTLFFELARLAEARKPSYLLFENVPYVQKCIRYVMYTNQICIAPPKNSGEKLFFLCSTVHNMFLLAKG